MLSHITIFFVLVFRNIISAPRRAIFVIINLIFAVLLIVFLDGYANSMFQGMRDNLIQTGLGHAQLFAEGLEERGNLQSVSIRVPKSIGKAELKRFEESDKILVVSPRLEGTVMATNGEFSQAGQIIGLKPDAESIISAGLRITAGREIFEDDTNHIVLGAGIARALQLNPGDSVTILGNTVDGILNAVDLEIVGLVTTGNRIADGRVMYVNLETLQDFMETDEVSRVVILLQDTLETQTFVDSQKELIATGLVLKTWRDLAPDYGEVVDLLGSIFLGIKIAVFCFVSLSISNMIATSVIERTQQIGISRAMGDSRFEVVANFAVEGMILGFIGGTIGIFLAVGLVESINAMQFTMPRPPGSSVDYPLRFLTSINNLILTFTLILVVTFFSSVTQAFKAARTPIIEALRHV